MSIAGRAIRGTAWVAAGTYLKAPMNFAANVALMRLIAPEDFGILAMAMFFLSIGRRAFGFGFNHALIHKQDDLDRVVPTHLALYTATGTAIFLLALIFRPLVHAGYGGDITTALLVLAFFGIAEYAGETARIRLEKELDFAALIKLDLFNFLASNVVAVVLALFGFGWWALVCKQALAWMIQSAGAWRLAPPMPGRRPDWKSVRWFFEFGKPMWIAGLATFISLRFDDFLVGSFADTESLGYYARAFSLASFPTAMVTHIVSRVAFPMYAKLQADREHLSEAFTQVLRFIVTLTSPMGVGLAIIAPEIIPLLFGPKWLPMVSLVRWLLVYACLRPIYDDCGELFTAIGKPKVASRILVLQAAAVLVTCPPLTWAFGAVGAAISVSFALLLGVVRAYQTAPLYVSLPFRAVFGPPLVACASGAAAVYASLAVFEPSGRVEILLVKGLVFSFTFLLILALTEGRTLLQDIRAIRRAGSDTA